MLPRTSHLVAKPLNWQRNLRNIRAKISIALVIVSAMPWIISLPPPPSSSHDNVRHGLIYVISGNPGCIAYYDKFLNTLSTLVSPLAEDVAFHIYGKDLAGFSDDEREPFSRANPPFDVEDQIGIVSRDIASQRIGTHPTREGQPFDLVILVGHSVGAYIALEIFDRHMRDPSGAPHLKLQHGILLFPTVTDIAQSPAGKRLDLMRTRPWLGRVVEGVVHGFLALQFRGVLRWIVRNVLGFSPEAAQVTARFLKSRNAVFQALYMGKDEMRVIADDNWPDELWESSPEKDFRESDVPKFFFFFGRKDHWVSNPRRDEFIKRRRSHAKGRTRIVIDEGNLRHGFCTRDESSIIVAGTVSVWIAEIAKGFS